MNWVEKLGDDPLLREDESTKLPGLATKNLLADASVKDEVVDTSEIAVDYQQAHAAAKESLDFLAALAMPTVFRYLFPPVLKAVWQWLLSFVHTSRTFPKLALGLPRGFAKTTVIKLFILYVILFTKRKFVLVVCANAALAENILADVIGYLEEPNIKSIFGDWKLGAIKDTQSLKRFGYRGRDIILAALGQGGSLRGMNLGNERPDIMLFDDIQTRECADSAVESAALERWMFGTAMKAKAPHGCMYIFVGNMYPTQYSILRKLKHNKTWVKFICGGILSDGTSLWEDLHPIDQLLEEYETDVEAGHAAIFHAEVLNDENAAVNNLIDLAKLPPLPCDDTSIPAGKFIIIDPSNDKWNSDAVSLGYFEIHDTKPVMMKCLEGRFSPGDTIKEAIKMALSTGTRLIFIEANAFQYSLLYWFNFITQQMGIIGLEAIDIYSGALPKNTRIMNWLKSYSSGESFIHPDARGPVHSQIIHFNPLKTNNIDGLLDLMTYAPRVIDEHGAYIVSQSTINEQEFGSIVVHSELETSPF